MDFSSDFLSEKAKSLTPYIAGLQPQDTGWVKLNTNESPYPPSPKVQEAITNTDIARLRLYPDSNSTKLSEAIANNLNLQPENIFCGNGSDEVLALAFQAFYSGKYNILTPDISYGFYPVWGKFYDAGLKQIPLRDDFTLDTANYKNANGVIIANPNAPTGLALGLSDVEKILCQNPKGVVLVDEAYIDFANVESAVSLLSQKPEHTIPAGYENLLVVRTFSKSHALAGLRVGYAIGHPKLIDALKRVRDAFNSYPLDMLAQTAAAAAIKDRPYLKKTITEVIKTRDNTTGRLEAMGYHVLPSQTNFILVKTPEAEGLYSHLLNHKILARYWHTPKLKNYLRVSIGTNSDMEAFIQCVQEYANAKQTKQT
ncbi:MAG: histidinol-phosphate transaminase [Defluviitaleaceae bacterium]|nr:histidinol-phosphate transaminase [Defluviitaleaceae bacterium]